MDFSKKITDTLGRSYAVDLALPNFDDIEEHAGFTLDTIVPRLGAKKEEDFLPWHLFLADSLKIFDVFYALVKPQADALSLTKKDVRKGFGTDEAEAAMVNATLQAIIDFFQKRDPPRAAALRKSIETHLTLATATAERMTRANEKIDLAKIVAAAPEISIEGIEAKVIEQLRNAAGGSPAMSASTPTPAGKP